MKEIKKIKLKVIPKPDEGTAAVFTRGDSKNYEPYITSEGGSYKLVCGFCELTLAEKVEFSQIQNIVLQCPKCKKYNLSSPPKTG